MDAHTIIANIIRANVICAERIGDMCHSIGSALGHVYYILSGESKYVTSDGKYYKCKEK